MPDKKIFIDTNIIIYSLGNTSKKTHLAAKLFVSSPFISTQVLSETANVASKRLAIPISEIRKLITALESMCKVEIISLPTIHTALDIQGIYRFSLYDILIVATALGAECEILYSEDMQNGQEIEGRMRIINPFV